MTMLLVCFVSFFSLAAGSSEFDNCKSAKAVTNNKQSIKDAACVKCVGGYPWWPCNNQALCKCAEKGEEKPPAPKKTCTSNRAWIPDAKCQDCEDELPFWAQQNPGTHWPCDWTGKNGQIEDLCNCTIDGETSTESEDTVVPTESEETVIPTESEETVVPTESEETVVPTESEETVVPTESEETVVPTESEETVLPTESEETVLPTESEETVLPTESEETVAPTESEETEEDPSDPYYRFVRRTIEQGESVTEGCTSYMRKHFDICKRPGVNCCTEIWTYDMTQENPEKLVKSDVDILWWNASQKRDYYLRPVSAMDVKDKCADKWDEGWNMVDGSLSCPEFMRKMFMHSYACVRDVDECCRNLQVQGEDGIVDAANKWEDKMCVRPWLNKGEFPKYNDTTDAQPDNNNWITPECHGKTAEECQEDACNFLMDPFLFPSLHRMDEFEQRRADELAGDFKDDFDADSKTLKHPLICVEPNKPTLGGMGFLSDELKIKLFDRQTPADMLPHCHAFGIAVDFRAQQQQGGVQYKRFDGDSGEKGYSPQAGTIDNLYNKVHTKAQQCLMPINAQPENGVCSHNGSGYVYNGPTDAVSFRELAKIWLDVTKNFKATPNGAEADRSGGDTSCAEAVTMAAGECNHAPNDGIHTIDDKLCSTNDIWQVSAKGVFATMGSCDDVSNPCCSAAQAYAHSLVEGQQLVIQSNTHDADTGYTLVDNEGGDPMTFSYNGNWLSPNFQTKTGGFNPVQENDQWVNEPGKKIDQRLEDLKRGSFMIPKCSHDENPWVKMYKEYVDPEAKFDSHSVYTQQEPCYFGPFGIWSEAAGYPGMPTYSAWGGVLEHYMESKKGSIDPSVQTLSGASEFESWIQQMNDGTWDSEKTNYQLAQEACQAVINGANTMLVI